MRIVEDMLVRYVGATELFLVEVLFLTPSIKVYIKKAGCGMADGERLVGIMHFGFVAKTPRPDKRTPAAKRWLHYPQI